RRHRCPHLPSVLYNCGKPCFITEYKDNYYPHSNTGAALPCRPKNHYQRNPEKMENTTTFRKDYVLHGVHRPKTHIAEYIKPEGVIDMGTTYLQDFKPYPVQPIPAAKSAGYKQPPARMDLKATYKDIPVDTAIQTVVWGIKKRQNLKTQDNLKLCTDRFSNTTTFQDDYHFKGPISKENFKPAHVPMGPIPFDGLSSYSQEYVPYSVEPYKCIEREPYKPSVIPFDGLTTQRKDYKGLRGEPSKPARSKAARGTPATKFNCSTEFHDNYISWPIRPIPLHKYGKHVPPEVAMNMTSTAHADFVEHKISPAVAICPQTQAWNCTPFESKSTMKDDYKSWDAKAAPLIRGVQQIEKPTGPFENTTTFRANYVSHAPACTLSCKPIPTVQCCQPLDSETTYCTSYIPKAIKTCPAGFANPPGYVYEKMEPCGHRLYRKLSARQNGNTGNAASNQCIGLHS
ncbi:SAXO1 protein, partial [Polyodon spathula]|nr:SAXO1 protein [Polyodon spathula]